MGSLLRQCGSAIVLNIASIPQRVAMSIASVMAVAMAVAVLLGFWALSNGFSATIKGSGAENVAVVDRKGSTSELSSILTQDQIRILETGPGLRQWQGHPLVSPELNLVVSAVKRSSASDANVPLRGVDPAALAIRANMHIVEGRMLAPGSNEVVVGRAMQREFEGFGLNNSVRSGPNVWKVVGVFEAPGTVFESEMWADARVVQSLFNRGSSYQIMRAGLANPGALAAYKSFVENDPRLTELQVRSERDYYANQSQGMITLINVFGTTLGMIMAVGALAGALNTMYSSVAARGAEIATLRIIGFSGFAAFVGTLAEALALSVLGGLVGALVCFVLFNGMTASTLSQNFSQVVFQLKMSPQLVINGMVIALIIGLIGGIFPGVRAALQKPQLELAAQ